MKKYIDLLSIIIASGILTIALLVFPIDILQIIIGLPFVLFFPGYTLVSALFTRKSSPGGLERIVLSFGMSITVVPLIGLLLNYTPWGIRLLPILTAINIFILAMSTIAVIRRSKLPIDDCFYISGFSTLSGWFTDGRASENTQISTNTPANGLKTSKFIRGTNSVRMDKALSILLIIVVILCAAALVYAFASIKIGEKFSEFYILGSDGKASDYPRKIKIGQSASVTAGIINREQTPMTYTVEVYLNDLKIDKITPITLGIDEKWEQVIKVKPSVEGNNQKVQLVLHKNTSSPPSNNLYFWIDVVK